MSWSMVERMVELNMTDSLQGTARGVSLKRIHRSLFRESLICTAKREGELEVVMNGGFKQKWHAGAWVRTLGHGHGQRAWGAGRNLWA